MARLVTVMTVNRVERKSPIAFIGMWVRGRECQTLHLCIKLELPRTARTRRVINVYAKIVSVFSCCNCIKTMEVSGSPQIWTSCGLYAISISSHEYVII